MVVIMWIILFINLILSKKDQKRLLFINNFYSKKINRKTFSIKNLNKIFYFNGREALMDIIYFKIFKSKKVDQCNLLTIIETFSEIKNSLNAH